MASCHDAARSGGLYLGPRADLAPEPDAATRAEIHAQLLAPSVTAPAVARVQPGAPKASFLLIKIDGCQDDVELECERQGLVGGPCGQSMPAYITLLAPEQRDVFRRWIIQGAALD